MNYLDIAQKISNLLYKIFGSKGFVIDYQVKINEKRYKKNIIDKKELNDNGFIQ